MEGNTLQELFEWASALIAQAHPFEAGRQLAVAELDWLANTHKRLSSMPRAELESALDVTKALVSHVWRHRPPNSDGLPVQWRLTPLSALRNATESVSVDLTQPPDSCALICGYLDSAELSTRGRLALHDGSARMAAEWRTTDVSLLHSVVLLTKYSLVVAAPLRSSSASGADKRGAPAVPRAAPVDCTYLEVSECIKLARPVLPGSPPSPPPLQLWAGSVILSVPQVPLRPRHEHGARLHLCGTVSALSPLIDYSASQPPFFLAEVRDERDFALHVLFTGECVAWHAFIQCGVPHLLTNLKPAVLFKNKANEMRVLIASAGGAAREQWTFPYPVDAAQARLLTAQGAGPNPPVRTRPDPVIDLSSPSKRHKASQSPRRRAKQRADFLTSLRDTLSYHGTITAQLGAYAYVLDDELRLYVSHSNCRPMGRCMAAGARVLVRKAHPIFDSEGNLKALGCCSYGNVEVEEFAPDKRVPWRADLHTAWMDLASQVSLTTFHWLVETAEILGLKFRDEVSNTEADLDPLRRQILQTLIEQLGLSIPKRNVYSEFTDHTRSCQLWQPPFVPAEVLLLREVKGLVMRASRLGHSADLAFIRPPSGPALPGAGSVRPGAASPHGQLCAVTERTLPRGQLVIGRLACTAEGEMQLVDGSDALAVVFPSDFHLSPSDLGSICLASRYTFFARRGARREVFLSCTPSARLQDSGAVLIRPTVASRVPAQIQAAYDNFVPVVDTRQLRTCFFYVLHKQTTPHGVDLACHLLLPPTPAPPSSPAALPRARYPYNEQGRADQLMLRATPALAALVQVGRCYWAKQVLRDNRDGHPTLSIAADVHEVVFLAAESRATTFPPPHVASGIEILTSAATLAVYTHRAEDRPHTPQDFHTALAAITQAGTREVSVTVQVVRTEVLSDLLRKRYGIHHVRGLACFVRDPSGLEPYELPAFIYEEHAGDGLLSVLPQCSHALIPGAVVSLRSFESSARQWPYLYTTARSSVTIESLPSALVDIDPLDRFRMMRQTTSLVDVMPSASGRDTKVYRLRCRADLFRLTLAWRCSLCGEPRLPAQRVQGKSTCQCADGASVFAMDSSFNLSDGTAEVSIDVSGEVELRRLLQITLSDEAEMNYLKEQTAKQPQARITISVHVRDGIQISDNLRALLQLPRIRLLLQRCTASARPLVFYAIQKPSWPAPRERDVKLKQIVVRTPAPPRIWLEMLSFEEVAPRAELCDLLNLVKKDVQQRNDSGRALLSSG